MRTIITLLSLIALVGCSFEPGPIPYGNSNCDFCRMNITDERFGAQLMSDKGKSFYFDALECQINYRLKNPDVNWAYSLATDYSQPKSQVSTDSVVVLQSVELPSPMGMNLSAFENRATALEFSKGASDRFFTYDELMQRWSELGKP